MSRGQQRSYVTYSEFVEENNTLLGKIDLEIGGYYDYSAIEGLKLPKEEEDIQKTLAKKALMADFDWRHPIHIYRSERPRIIQVGLGNTTGRHIPSLESFYKATEESRARLHKHSPHQDEDVVYMPLYRYFHRDEETKLLGYFWTGLTWDDDESASNVGRGVCYVPIPPGVREFCEKQKHCDALLKMVLCAREMANEGEFTKSILSLIESETPGKRQRKVGSERKVGGVPRAFERYGGAYDVMHCKPGYEGQGLALCSSL